MKLSDIISGDGVRLAEWGGPIVICSLVRGRWCRVSVDAYRTETIVWHPASEPPDHRRVVIIQRIDGSTTFGSLDQWGDWFDELRNVVLSGILRWAEMPRGPKGER